MEIAKANFMIMRWMELEDDQGSRDDMDCMLEKKLVGEKGGGVASVKQ